MKRGIEQGMERGIEQGMERGMERGIEQGMERGIERGREQQRSRRREALDRFGVEVNGVRMLPDTPEVQNFLDGDEE